MAGSASGGDACVLLRADLHGGALDAPSVQCDRAHPTGSLAHCVIVGQEVRSDGTGQEVPLALLLGDSGVQPRELGVTLSGQLTASSPDRRLFLGQAIDLTLRRLQGLHGGQLGLLQHGLTPSELVDLTLDSRQVPGACPARGQALAQHPGTAHHLADLVLAACGLLLGLAQAGVSDHGLALVGLQPLHRRLDAGEHGQVPALVPEPRQGRVQCLELDEQPLLGKWCARHVGGPSGGGALRRPCSVSGSRRR